MRESVRDSTIDKNADEETLSETLVVKIQDFIYEKFYQTFIDKRELEEILDSTLMLVEDIVVVHTKVVPCFPPKYNIFQVYKEKYLKFIYERIKPFMNEDDLKNTPGHLILIAKWLDKFEEVLRKVGIDIKTTEIGSVRVYINNRILNITCIYSMIMLTIF